MGGLQGLGLLDNDCKGRCRCPWKKKNPFVKKNPRLCRNWSEELQDRKYTHSCRNLYHTFILFPFTIRFTVHHDQSNL